MPKKYITYPAELSLLELSWLSHWLSEIGRKLPQNGRNSVAFNATRCSGEEIYRVCRRDALDSRCKVWIAVEERANSGVWPKVDKFTAFWLRARFQSAREYVADELEKSKYSAHLDLSTPPKDALGTAKAILLDLWDEQLVDIWLADHLGDLTWFEKYKYDPHDLVNYEVWLEDLRAGKFVNQ